MSKTTDAPQEAQEFEHFVFCQPTDIICWIEALDDVIRFTPTQSGGAQDIFELPLDRCRDHYEILGWVHHLSDKTWMTAALMRHFIEFVCEEIGLDVPMMTI